jgi:DNA-binding cell septation regulator SpoVG
LERIDRKIGQKNKHITMKININEIEVKIKFLEDKKLKAIIGLDFGDFVVKGFRVMTSEFENRKGEKLWLVPPSYLGGGRYHPIFYMTNKPLWEQLEDRIWEEYERQNKKHFGKMFGIDDEELPK